MSNKLDRILDSLANLEKERTVAVATGKNYVIPSATMLWMLHAFHDELCGLYDNYSQLEAQLGKAEKPRYPVGVSVLLTYDNRSVLLGERKNCSAAGMFSTPGGRIEPGEDYRSTAVRELKEETGLSVDNEKVHFLAFREWLNRGPSFDAHYFMIYAHVDFADVTGWVVNGIPDKCVGWNWIPLNEIPQNCTEPKDVIAEIVKKANPLRYRINEMFHFCNGQLVKSTNNQPVPSDEPVFILRARDALAAPVIRKYIALMTEDNVDHERVESVANSLSEFISFRNTHPDRMKQPGITKGK